MKIRFKGEKTRDEAKRELARKRARDSDQAYKRIAKKGV